MGGVDRHGKIAIKRTTRTTADALVLTSVRGARATSASAAEGEAEDDEKRNTKGDVDGIVDVALLVLGTIIIRRNIETGIAGLVSEAARAGALVELGSEGGLVLLGTDKADRECGAQVLQQSDKRWDRR